MTHPNREELLSAGERAFTAWAATSKADSTPLMWTWDEMPEEQRQRWAKVAAAALRQSPSVILWQTNDGHGWWEVEDPEFWKAKGCPVRGLGVVTGEEGRQSPSVEEVARVIREHVGIGEISECSIEIVGQDEAAQAIADLYGGRDG